MRSPAVRPRQTSRPAAARATITGSPTIVSDATRGNVIQFTGTGQRVNAGSTIIPVMTLTNDFTWSFWASSAQGAKQQHHRRQPLFDDRRHGLSPREFIKVHDQPVEFPTTPPPMESTTRTLRRAADGFITRS